MDDLAAALEGVQFDPDPAPADPAPANHAPADPAPDNPSPADPAPANPAPADPAPANPAPANPAPANPAPDNPAPANPAPAEPAPAEPAPANPAPANPAPDAPFDPNSWHDAYNFTRVRRPISDRPSDYFTAVRMNENVLEELENKDWDKDTTPDEEFFDNGSVYRWVRVDGTVRNPRARQNFLVCFGDDEYLILPAITAISRVLQERTTEIKWIVSV
eukprot:g25113.t1